MVWQTQEELERVRCMVVLQAEHTEVELQAVQPAINVEHPVHTPPLRI